MYTDRDILSDDHADVDVLLDDAINGLRGGAFTEAVDAVDLFWARLAVHIRAEHLHLFPAVLKISAMENPNGISDILETLERLRVDHNFFMHELAAVIKSMRAASAETAPEVIRDAQLSIKSVRDRLAEHNVIEEQRIYPLMKLLSPSEGDALLCSLAHELDNLPLRFATGK